MSEHLVKKRVMTIFFDVLDRPLRTDVYLGLLMTYETFDFS
jgi:hypothetical protein